MNYIETMKQALEALNNYGAITSEVYEAITALRLAIEQAEREDHIGDATEMVKPVAYGIRQITDDEGVEEWEDIRTSPDRAREEADDMMATGKGEIYKVVPLYAAPPQRQPLTNPDTERLDWLTFNLSGKALRDIGVVWSEHSNARAAIDEAMAAHGIGGEA